MSESPNSVILLGRVSAAPETRELPSGDVLVTFRLIVERPPPIRGERRQVDVVDIACWSKRTQRSAASLAPDSVVRVEGAVRRRFFRAAGAAASRYEIEAERVLKR